MIARRVAAVLLVAGLAAGSLVWLSCQGPSSGGAVHIVKLDGAASGRNLSLSQFLWTHGEPGTRPAFITARGGDILCLDETDKAEGFIVQYRASDGDALSISSQPDTGRGLIGGKTVTVSLREDAAWDWLAKASDADHKSLRFLSVESAVTPDRAKVLEALAKVNPAVDLRLEKSVAQADPADLGRALAGFRPAFLFVDTEVLAKFKPPAAMLQNVTALYLNGDCTDIGPDLLKGMPHLEALFMQDAGAIQSMGVAGAKGLRALSLADGTMKDLAAVAPLTGLEELCVNGDDVTDLSALAKLTRLRVLSLTRCPKAADLAPLKGLPLTMLAPPPAVTQAQFDAVLADHPGLEGLELVALDKQTFVNVKDLSAVKNLRALKVLVVTDMSGMSPVTLDVLKQLKGLRMLVLPKDFYALEAAAKLQDLQKALPNTAITEGAGICLGSGWLLVLLPVVAAAAALAARARRHRAARA